MGRKKVEKGKRANNEGTIVQLPSGRWRAAVSLGLKEDGTRNRQYATFDTEKEANAWKIRSLSTAQEYGAASVVDVSGMFVPKFHAWLLNEKQSDVYSQQFHVMMCHYRNYIKPYFLKYKQTDLTKNVFQKFFKYLEDKEVGVETRKKTRALLKQYFEKEYENSPMRNPLDGVKYVTKKKAEIINPDEVMMKEDYKAVPLELREKFLEALDKDQFSRYLKPLCYLMYFTGNRIGETLPYQWKDFNFDKRYFLVYKAVTREYKFDENGDKVGKSVTDIKPPKSKDGVRPLPLLDILYEVLMEWRDYRIAQEKVTGISFTAPDDYIFSSNKGELRSEWGTSKMFRRFLERNNLDKKGIHFHALRQTFSNSLFARDSEDKTITDILGHSDIETSKEHYNSISKYDSVQKTARMFNAQYKPKNAKYCADESVTFAPNDYIPEQASPKSYEIKEPSAPKRELTELLDELASYPEFHDLLKKATNLSASKTNNSGSEMD